MIGSRPRAIAAPLVLVLSGAALALPLSRAGIWEPRELQVAELSRRIAAGLLGATSLGVPADPPALPSLGDLGSGELPFVAIGAAFRVFGLHPWAGRIAMLAFALAGLAAIGALLARFASPRAAALGGVVLASTPLYAAHARTMLGDAAAMGAFAVAFAGLCGMVLERRTLHALAWSPVAAVGLIAGFLARGLLFGVAVPLVAASAGALLLGPALGRACAQRRVTIGCTGLALGVACVIVFTEQALAHRHAASGVVTRVTGIAFEAPASGATFATALRRLGHAMFPWSILAPIAIGRALAPAAAAQDEEAVATSGLRVLVVLGSGVALAADAFVTPWAIDPPFVGVAAFAATVALALDDLARGAAPSRAVTAGTAMLAAILGVDLVRDPDRVLAAFGAASGEFPTSLAASEKRWILAVAASFAIGGAVASSFGTRAPSGRGPRAVLAARLGDARSLLRVVSTAWGGHLAFVLVVVEAALVGLAAMVVVGRALEWSSITRLPDLYQRAFGHLFWAVPACLAAGLALVTLGADVLRAAARRARTSPPVLGAALAAVAAFAFVVGFHPSLAAQLSPREALEAFAVLHRDPEPLGLLGMSPRVVAYHGGGDVRSFARAEAAFAWLAGDDAPPQPGAPRRWLVLPDRDLAKLNVLHRQRFGKNLPVADATSSRTLLAVSALDGLPERSPLRDVVLDEHPDPGRPVHARFGDELELIGWEARDERGERIDAVATRTHVEARFYVRVLAPVDPSYAPFLHVDRGKLRFNGDDAFADRGYGPADWLPGDVVVLTCDVMLEANFPIGDADVYFGFFAGSTRMKVTEGAASLDRAKLGKLRVR